MEKLREVFAKKVGNAYIYKCSMKRWIREAQEDLEEFKKAHKGKLTKLSPPDKVYYNILKKSCTEEYYKKHWRMYDDDLKILKDPKATRKQLLAAFSRHDLSFDEDIKNGTYEMSNLGWHDNYRVSGYPTVTHHNAEEAIKFLEEYDNGSNIQYDYTQGMCNEIRDIITNFFNEFPNGTIHYG